MQCWQAAFHSVSSERCLQGTVHLPALIFADDRQISFSRVFKSCDKAVPNKLQQCMEMNHLDCVSEVNTTSGLNGWCHAFDAVFCVGIWCESLLCSWELCNPSEVTDDNGCHPKSADVEACSALGLKRVLNELSPFSKVVNECKHRLVETYLSNPNSGESRFQKTKVRLTHE